MLLHALSIIPMIHVGRKSFRRGDGKLTILEMVGPGLELPRNHTTDPNPA